MAIEKQMIDPNAKFVINASILTGHTLRWENGIIKIYNRFGMPDTAFRAADMPTVDAVEVVHGHWCWEGKFKACSECGSYVEWDETLGANFWKFCPYCGAKMEATE